MRRHQKQTAIRQPPIAVRMPGRDDLSRLLELRRSAAPLSAAEVCRCAEALRESARQMEDVAKDLEAREC